MPQNQKSAADIVADAKKAYVAAGGGKMSPMPATPAPSSAAVKSTPSVKPAPAKAPTTMDELKVRQANIDKVKASLPKLHDGGPVKVDGAYQLKAGEHVLTAAEAARARKHALIHSGMRSLANPMEKPAKPEVSKVAEKKTSITVKPSVAMPKKVSMKK